MIRHHAHFEVGIYLSFWPLLLNGLAEPEPITPKNSLIKDF